MKKLINTKRVCAAALALAMALALIIPSLSMPASAANTQRFTDVDPNAWYAEAVNAMADAGIVNGVGNNKFEPNRPMTAGELATVLWNLTYGKLCKASELLMYVGTTYSDLMTGVGLDFGYNPNQTDYPQFEKIGRLVGAYRNKDGNHVSIQLTSWDGPVSVAVYGNYYHLNSRPFDDYAGDIAGRLGANMIANSQIGNAYRAVGKTTPAEAYVDSTYSRDLSGTDIANMSKDYITRGFAISELVNVLRDTKNLYYFRKTNAAQYPDGTAIPDWADITNIYHDVYTSINTYGSARTSDWNYISYPGKTVISGGYANTWFSPDILLAYQYGLIQGKDGTGRCDVNAYMTRAEVCQMLYNANVLNTLYKYGDRRTNNYSPEYAFVRDSKVYLLSANASYTVISCMGAYDPNNVHVRYISETTDGYQVYNSKIDIRKQEWPTHPEFWG